MHFNYHELFIDLCLIGAKMQVYQNCLFQNVIFTFSALYSIPENLNIIKFLVLLEIALLFPVLPSTSEVLDHDKHSPMQGSHWIQIRKSFCTTYV